MMNAMADETETITFTVSKRFAQVVRHAANVEGVSVDEWLHRAARAEWRRLLTEAAQAIKAYEDAHPDPPEWEAIDEQEREYARQAEAPGRDVDES
jgi:phosphoribulokinase